MFFSGNSLSSWHKNILWMNTTISGFHLSWYFSCSCLVTLDLNNSIDLFDLWIQYLGFSFYNFSICTLSLECMKLNDFCFYSKLKSKWLLTSSKKFDIPCLTIYKFNEHWLIFVSNTFLFGWIHNHVSIELWTHELIWYKTMESTCKSQ